MQPLVSVVITSCNNAETVENCLKSLAAVDYPRYEAIFVDGNSDDGTAGIIRRHVKKYPVKLKLLFDSKAGVAAARNIGIKESRGDIIVFSDADCIFEKDWLQNLVRRFGKNTGAVGGPDQCPQDSLPLSHAIDYAMTSFIGTGGLRRGEASIGKYHPKGCNLAIKKSVLKKVGLFDERLSRRGEENELDFRIRKKGYEIGYAPSALVWHVRRGSLKNFWKQSFSSGMARVEQVKIQPGMFEWAHVLPPAFVLYLLSLLFFAHYRGFFRLYALPAVAYLSLLFSLALAQALRKKMPLLALYIPAAVFVLHAGYGAGTLKRLLKPIFQ